MIHPSYVDLMKVVNSDVEEGDEPVISSRYSIVMATARRARQLIAGDEPLVRARPEEKALSIAVSELNDGMIQILTDEQKAEMEERRIAEATIAEYARLEEAKARAEAAGKKNIRTEVSGVHFERLDGESREDAADPDDGQVAED